MIKGISHIGLAVHNIEEARTFFKETLGVPTSQRETFGELLFSFAPMDGTDIELLQSTTPSGQIAKFIDKKGEGVHHIAFRVDDIMSEIARLKKNGIKVINEEPYLNAHKDWVAFLHPKSTFGVLIELIQSGP